MGIRCVIRQFLVSQELIVAMMFEWPEFLVEVQTEKKPKSPTKNRKNRKKKTEGLGLVFFSGFFVATPPPPNDGR